MDIRMDISLDSALLIASAIFCVGVYGVLSRQNLLVILMSLELMLNSVNLILVALGRAALGTATPPPQPSLVHVFVIMILAVAAAEAGVGLAIVLAVFRNWRTTNAGDLELLKG
jgi:NADH:ubiquinone oxidoreductase subunit K